MAFWGCQLKPNVKTPVKLPQTDILHLSQLCLHEPKDGKNLVQVTVKGATYTIACLEKNKHEHDSVDLFFGPDECAFTNKGSSEVHLMGYLEPEQDDFESEEEEGAAAPKPAAVASPRHSSKVAPAAAPATNGAAKMSPKQSPKVAAPAADESDMSDMPEEGEEEEPMGDEEVDSEEEAAPAPKSKGGNKPAVIAAPAQSPKRKAAEPAASPAKKPKADEPAKAAPAGEADFVKELVIYLKKNGKTAVSLLGTKVKKPDGLPKLKFIFEKNKDKFVMAGGDVTAK